GLPGVAFQPRAARPRLWTEPEEGRPQIGAALTRRRGYGVLTLSIIKADTGGYVGHSAVHPRAIEVAQKAIDGVKGNLLIDGQVSYCGDDLSLIMTHEHGLEAEQVHAFAWDVFLKTTAGAKELGLHGPG